MKKWRKSREVEEKTVVLVAVEGKKEIKDYALEWAVRNVVQPQDTLILLALLSIPPPPPPLNNHSTLLPHFFSSLFRKRGNGVSISSSSGNKESSSLEEGKGTMQENEIGRVNEICAEMMNELCSQNNIRHVQTLVKLIPESQLGSVADSAEQHQANWVILDRRLKRESESCLRRLDSNIILIDHAIPKILQLKRQVIGIEEEEEEEAEGEEEEEDKRSYMDDSLSTTTSIQSNESFRSSNSSTVTSTSSSSNSERDTSRKSNPHPPSRLSQSQQLFRPKLHTMGHHLHHQFYGAHPVSSVTGTNKKNPDSSILEDILQEKLNINTNKPSLPMGSGIVSEVLLPKKVNRSRSTSTPPGLSRRLSMDSRTQRVNNQTSSTETPTETSRQQPVGISCRTFRDGSNIEQQQQQQRPSSALKTRPSVDRTSSIRRDISLSIKQPHKPPPLCSVCKHAAPVFGKPPRKFIYEEIEKATNVFSPANFLAEGGFGPVYKGMLEDGQVVAVKKHKKVSAQGAAEFCSEVEVLSCAQHRNLVMLVGYCIDEDWLLVYEFACNGSLDKHLYGINAKEVMPWHQRQKVAVGAARGLRYLHEDCRVGCIIHRDLRPNNILLTHDFEPMVGDFGLARWQANGQSAEETRIVGTFGYLAPEYTQTGQITEKADVYAFGVLLLELISGVKAIDLARGTGQQYLPQWARPLMEMNMIHELIDPRLNGNYVKWEVECMIHASSLCIMPDPDMRPRMSKVLRILEGDMGSELPAMIPQYQHVPIPQFPLPPFHHPPVPLLSSHHPHHKYPMFIKPTTRPSHSQFQQYPPQFFDEFKHLQNNNNNNNGAFAMIDQTGNNTLMVHNQNENNLKEEYEDYLQGLFDEFLHKANGLEYVKARHLSGSSTDDLVTPRARRIY